MNNDNFKFTIDQSIALKGLGIILIVFHNFFHQLDPKFYENEFSFRENIFQNYVTFVLNDPFQIIRSLFSFYGHLGVSIFIVLSAFGLTARYGGKPINYRGFLIARLWRLYPIFLVAILVHALTIAWWRPEPWSEWAIAYLAKLSLLTNFIPGFETKVTGPWWFFSLIVQYYLLFSAINFFVKKGKIWALLALAVAGWLAVYAIDPLVPVKLKFTVIGWLPEFSLGIALAKGYRFKRTSLIVGAAFATFVAGHFFREAWVFQSFSFALLFFLAAPKFLKILSDWPLLSRFLILAGGLSFPLFATHGPLRYPFQMLVACNDTWWFAILMACAFFVVAILVSAFADKIDKSVAKFRVHIDTHHTRN